MAKREEYVNIPRANFVCLYTINVLFASVIVVTSDH